MAARKDDATRLVEELHKAIEKIIEESGKKLKRAVK